MAEKLGVEGLDQRQRFESPDKVVRPDDRLGGAAARRRKAQNDDGRRQPAQRHDHSASEGRPVLVHEAPPAFDGFGGDIVVGICHVIVPRAVANFNIENVLGRFIDEMMRVAGPGPEPGANLTFNCSDVRKRGAISRLSAARQCGRGRCSELEWK